MKDTLIERKEFLKALIDYANKSGKINPHFYKKEMMDILNISETDFNRIRRRLGQQYCVDAGPHKGKDRYAINVSECLSRQEQYDQESINKKQHNQILMLAILLAILSAVISVAF